MRPTAQQVAERSGVSLRSIFRIFDDVESLRRRALTRVEVTFAEAPPPGTFDAVPGVREVDRSGHVVRLTLEGSADPLVKALARFEVNALDSHEADLEDVFLELYRRPAGAG